MTNNVVAALIPYYLGPWTLRATFRIPRLLLARRSESRVSSPGVSSIRQISSGSCVQPVVTEYATPQHSQKHDVSALGRLCMHGYSVLRALDPRPDNPVRRAIPV